MRPAPALEEDESLLLQHVADGALLAELPGLLNIPVRKASALYGKLCDRLRAPRKPAVLLAICYATGAAQPAMLDPSDIAMPVTERELLPLMAVGMTLEGMAQHLGLSRGMVERRVQSLMENLQAKTWAQAVHLGWQYQIVTADVITAWLRTGAIGDTASDARPARSPALYIQAREAEVAETSRALCLVRGRSGERPVLSYWDQTADDRDEQGTLWARYSEVLSHSGRPVGPAVPSRHPIRQFNTMRRQRCRVGFCPARLDLGKGHAHLYLVTANELLPDGSGYRTVEPPTCIDHALLCAETEPRLQGGYTALLVSTSTISGVLGKRFAPLDDGINVGATRDETEFHPYADRDAMRSVLAYQLARDLTSYKPIELRRLVRASFQTAPLSRPSAPRSSRPPGRLKSHPSDQPALLSATFRNGPAYA